MRMTFVRNDAVAADIKTFWFKPEHPVRQIAGQFITVHLPHTPTDERGTTREFSLSSSPTEPYLGITVKFARYNSSTYKQALLALRPGAVLDFDEPMGDFVLPKDKSIPLVWIAGGMGITPFRSMAMYLHAVQEQRSIQFFYAAHSELATLFDSDFSQVDIPRHVVTNGDRLTAEYLLQSQIPNDALFYIAGPETFVEEIATKLGNRVGKNRIVTDSFPGYRAI